MPLPFSGPDRTDADLAIAHDLVTDPATAATWRWLIPFTAYTECGSMLAHMRPEQEARHPELRELELSYHDQEKAALAALAETRPTTKRGAALMLRALFYNIAAGEGVKIKADHLHIGEFTADDFEFTPDCATGISLRGLWRVIEGLEAMPDGEG